ncbi:MAG: hypothetical protein QM765_35120 [Myxococcales bacterium]
MSCDFQVLFESTPACTVVLSPDSPRFTILAATDLFLAATRTRRAEARRPRGLRGLRRRGR